MALREALNTRPSSPYSRPPFLHIHVLKEIEKSHVISWDFSNDLAAPKIKKNNKIIAITDGHSVSKVTLYEELSPRVTAGKNYLIKGYRLKGAHPPYVILPSRDTVFYKTFPVPLPITEALRQEAEQLLEPPSVPTPLRSVDQTKGSNLLTLEGKVLDLSAIRRVRSGRDEVPVRQVTLEQDGATVNLSLWREAAVFKLEVGCSVRLTHVKRSSMAGQYQSTSFTELKEVSDVVEEVEVIGTAEGSQKGVLELVLHNEDTLVVEEKLWEPYQEAIEEGPVKIMVQRGGRKVVKITSPN